MTKKQSYNPKKCVASLGYKILMSHPSNQRISKRILTDYSCLYQTHEIHTGLVIQLSIFATTDHTLVTSALSWKDWKMHLITIEISSKSSAKSIISSSDVVTGFYMQTNKYENPYDYINKL